MLERTDADGLDGTGYTPELSQRYLYGSAIDEVLAVEDAAGDVLWGLADHEGTIRDLVDSTGTVQEHRQYDTFGQITSPATPTADFPQAFTGRPLDADTGLYDYRARWYDPAGHERLSFPLRCPLIRRLQLPDRINLLILIDVGIHLHREPDIAVPGKHLGRLGGDVGFAEVGDEGVADGVEVGVEASVVAVGEEVAAVAAAVLLGIVFCLGVRGRPKPAR